MQEPSAEAAEQLASVHTNSFTQLLSHFGVTLAVSTYQAGKLILARADGEVTNTHFHSFNKPMGMAAKGDRLALGTAAQILDFRNVSAAAAKLQPQGKHDAAYVLRRQHVTGDIDIHEMAWADDELWFANTRFSCLCTMDASHSFVPRWRPSFISAYDMRDRCHLNGLALRDGEPRYMTALGETDEPAGWRKNKASGGILMDVTTDKIFHRGLSMPHSPRWYQGKLWVLESGKGSLAYRDARNGKMVTVAELPGFTRGLDFVGDYAFIGLSQVRETAVFSGLPLTRTQPVRYCGVWVVDIRNGDIVAFLRFEKGVQEVFAVSILPWKFAGMVEADTQVLGSTYVLPDEALRDVVQPSEEWTFAETYFEKGNQLYNDGKAEEALPEYKKCLEMQPDYLPARYNLGVVLGNLARHEEAIAELEKVLEAESGHVEALNSLGFSCGELRCYEDAAGYLRRAVDIRPEYAQAHHNLGLILLRLGLYDEGWEECEWRWKTAEFNEFKAPQPLWGGEQLEGTLLIHTEQGAGDAVQFARFIPLAAERCDKILLVCPDHLQRLFKDIPGVDECIGPGEIDLDRFQARLPIMSLAKIFAPHPGDDKTETPYLPLIEGAGMVLPDNGRPKVGICWAGSATQAKDAHRSTKLADWQPILDVPGVDFVSLQVDETASQADEIPDKYKVFNAAPHLQDYADTTAIVDQLDLVISVDTSVAHVAGALGKPTWTMVYHTADWRYPMDSETTPWYPSMSCFWQKAPNDWQPVIEEVATNLEEWLAAR